MSYHSTHPGSGRRGKSTGSQSGPGPTTRRKPVKGVGRHKEQLYCGRCGHKKTGCICPK